MQNPKIIDQTESEELFESEYDYGPWIEYFRERASNVAKRSGVSVTCYDQLIRSDKIEA